MLGSALRNVSIPFNMIIGDMVLTPMALRWQVFLQFFVIVVVLETAILVLTVRPRFQMLLIMPIANVITSFLLAPWFAHEADDWGGSLLLQPAYIVRSHYFDGTSPWPELALLFFVFFLVLGLPTVAIEGAIVQYFGSERTSKAWLCVLLANLLSYLLLTISSISVGSS